MFSKQYNNVMIYVEKDNFHNRRVHKYLEMPYFIIPYLI